MTEPVPSLGQLIAIGIAVIAIALYDLIREWRSGSMPEEGEETQHCGTCGKRRLCLLVAWRGTPIWLCRECRGNF